MDVFDPYRLPARQTEVISLPFTRPDSLLTFDADAEANFFAIATEDANIVLLTESGYALEVEGMPT